MNTQWRRGGGALALQVPTALLVMPFSKVEWSVVKDWRPIFIRRKIKATQNFYGKKFFYWFLQNAYCFRWKNLIWVNNKVCLYRLIISRKLLLFTLLYKWFDKSFQKWLQENWKPVLINKLAYQIKSEQWFFFFNWNYFLQSFERKYPK